MICYLHKRNKSTFKRRHVFEWPKDGALRLSGLLSDVRSAQILGQRTRNLWPSERDGDAVVFKLPTEPLDPIATVVAVDLAEPLAFAALPEINAADDRFTGSLDVDVKQPASKVTYRYTTDGSEPTVKSPEVRSPIPLAPVVRVAAFDTTGRKGHTATLRQPGS